ncbi:MAG: LEPR-XLL domain-containing protein [Phycisphaerales bacterium]|nr:LEPR-XLL domain-containing protein [Phycisphaerales bacterium]
MDQTRLEALEPRVLLSAFLVDNAADSVDGNYGLGQMALREAIILANANPGADSITFSPLLGGRTITLLHGELGISDDLAIAGLGASSLAISGNSTSRVFSVATGVTASIEGLTITDGEAAAAKGGGIHSAGTLTLTNMVVSGNSAGQAGGGIYSSSSTLTLTMCVVSGNSADDYGGGILSDGVLSLTGSTVSGNSAGNGGGIYTSGVLTLTNSTVSGNTAVYAGGGIFSSSATLALTNSTIAENRGTSAGGGIYNGVGSGAVLISTIVALNPGGDVDGDPVAAGSVKNLIGDPGSAGGLINGVNGNIVGADPQLAPLADNGGPTRTHALLAGSTAIDKGSNPLGLALDQRGAGFPRMAGASTDIGAYEWAPVAEFSLNALAGAAATTATISDDTHFSAVRNADGDIIVFVGGGTVWTALRLRDHTGAPAATGDPIAWTDPNDGLVYLAAPSAGGFLLFRRAEDGSWSFRDLAAETSDTADAPVGTLTYFITRPKTGSPLLYIAGLNGAGEIVAYLQTDASTTTSQAAWALHNISDDLLSQAMTTPAFTRMTSYVTSWNQWTLAGLDASGNVQGVWINVATFTTWRLDNLSSITGADPLTGELDVTLTSWGGIRFAGASAGGKLIASWWNPTRGPGNWKQTDLTDQITGGGPLLTSGKLTAWFVPSTDNINYAGFNSEGDVIRFSWQPRDGARWNADSLTSAVANPQDRPVGAISAHASDAGTVSILGSSTALDVVRLWAFAGSETFKLDNLTSLATRA